MKLFFALILALELSTPSWAAEGKYERPYPHSSGADLLPYCQQTDVVVSQLRCDYYVQGVADLATFPVRGVSLACIPKGLNRTELMQLSVEYLASLRPQSLEGSSAASLLLKNFQKQFPCAKKANAKMDSKMEEAIKRHLEKSNKKSAE
jgi:hypothetical protein